jgi:hypothetical protein
MKKLFSDEVNQRIDKVLELKMEQVRLLRILKYYKWLQDYGIAWDEIEQVAQVMTSHRTQMDIRVRIKELGIQYPECGSDRYVAFLYRMKDGSTVTAPQPPFPPEVYLNKALLDAGEVLAGQEL